VARAYAAWILSRPFDIGNTTRNGLGSFLQERWWQVCKRQGFAASMTQAALASNQGSKANGSLMRCTPLGVWGHRLPPERLALLARQDSRLSHPNPASADAVACYVLALGSLVRNPGDAPRAFFAAQSWATQHACQEVKDWLDQARRGQDVPYQPMDGFVRIGFVWAMRHLLARTPYREAIAQTLRGGGDTDTNACIVGGMVGALHGAEGIPEAMRQAVLGCDTRVGPKPRPSLLDASAIPSMVEALMARAPIADPE
jgi:ADP-ribosylglycohydrolase